MSTTKRIIWEAPDGSILVTIPVEPMLDGEPEGMYLDRVALRAQNADPRLADCTRRPDVEAASLPPRRWRAVWRRVAGAVGVPLARARALRRLELVDRQKALLLRLRDLIEDAEDRGQTTRLAALRAKRQQVRLVALDAALAAVADLATLDTFEPPEFGGVE